MTIKVLQCDFAAVQLCQHNLVNVSRHHNSLPMTLSCFPVQAVSGSCLGVLCGECED